MILGTCGTGRNAVNVPNVVSLYERPFPKNGRLEQKTLSMAILGAV